MLFDNRTYHTALPNNSAVDRRSLTIRYIPSWCRPLGAIANNAAALDAASKLNTPLRRQLLGLESAASVESRFDPEGSKENWYDPAFCALTPRPDLR